MASEKVSNEIKQRSNVDQSQTRDGKMNSITEEYLFDQLGVQWLRLSIVRSLFQTNKKNNNNSLIQKLQPPSRCGLSNSQAHLLVGPIPASRHGTGHNHQPTKSYHFFLASHHCQNPSLFSNICNFVLQTITSKMIVDEIKQFWMEICNQRICVTSYSAPFSPSESLPVSPSSTISIFFS